MTVDDYDRSARETIARGTRFTYNAPGTGEPRVGFFDRATGHFTALTDDEAILLTHYPLSEAKIRALPNSTYS